MPVFSSFFFDVFLFFSSQRCFSMKSATMNQGSGPRGDARRHADARATREKAAMPKGFGAPELRVLVSSALLWASSVG